MELSIIAVVIDNLEITKRFISSIKQYTKDYELILIDNGSKDKQVIDFIKSSADIYYRFENKIDLAKAWNKGISLSKGNFVTIANNDTVVPPNWFNPLKETLTKNKKAGLVSPLTYALIMSCAKGKNLKKFDLKSKIPYKLSKFKDIVWCEFCVFKKEALKEVDGFCELYKVASGEDLEMNFSLYSKGYDIYLDPRIFLYHQGGASQVESIISNKERDNIWNKNFKLFKSRWPKYTKGWK